MGRLIPAQYIGEHEVMLSRHGGPYIDVNGKPLESRLLHKGDVIHMNEEEVNGFTVILDPRAEKEPMQLGAGRVVLPEHSKHSDIELSALGYQFHQGRCDFKPYTPKPVLKKEDSK